MQPCVISMYCSIHWMIINRGHSGNTGTIFLGARAHTHTRFIRDRLSTNIYECSIDAWSKVSPDVSDGYEWQQWSDLYWIYQDIGIFLPVSITQQTISKRDWRPLCRTSYSHYLIFFFVIQLWKSSSIFIPRYSFRFVVLWLEALIGKLERE